MKLTEIITTALEEAGFQSTTDPTNYFIHLKNHYSVVIVDFTISLYKTKQTPLRDTNNQIGCYYTADIRGPDSIEGLIEMITKCMKS